MENVLLGLFITLLCGSLFGIMFWSGCRFVKEGIEEDEWQIKAMGGMMIVLAMAVLMLVVLGIAMTLGVVGND